MDLEHLPLKPDSSSTDALTGSPAQSAKPALNISKQTDKLSEAPQEAQEEETPPSLPILEVHTPETQAPSLTQSTSSAERHESSAERHEPLDNKDIMANLLEDKIIEHFNEMSDLVEVDADLPATPDLQLNIDADAEVAFESTETLPEIPLTDKQIENYGKQVNRVKERLDHAIEKSKFLMGQITNLDAQLISAESRLKNLQRQAEDPKIRENTYLKDITRNEIVKTIESINTLRDRKQGFVDKLEFHKEELYACQAALNTLIKARSTSEKMKGILHDAKSLVVAAGSEISVIDSLKTIYEVTKTGKQIEEYKEAKESLEAEKQRLEGFTEEINRINEEKSSLLLKRSESLDNLKAQLAQCPASQPELKTQYEKAINSLTREIKKSTDHYAYQHAQLEKVIANQKLVVEECENAFNDIKAELYDKFSSELLSKAFEQMDSLISYADRFNTAIKYTSIGLNALRLADGFVTGCEPVVHLFDTVLPFIALPFSLYDTGKGAYGIYKSGQQSYRLHQISKVRQHLKQRAEELQEKHGVTFDEASLEILRLQEVARQNAFQMVREIETDAKTNSILENAIEEEMGADEGGEINLLDELVDLDMPSEEYLHHVQGQEKSIDDQVQVIRELKEMQSCHLKSEALRRFIHQQGVSLAQSFTQNGLSVASGVTGIAASGISIAGLAGGPFTAPAAVATGTALGLACTGIALTGVLEQGAFDIGYKINQMYKMRNGEFIRTIAGNNFVLGMIMREEMHQEEKPVTQCMLKYLDVKNPKKFIDGADEEMASLMKHHPDAIHFHHEVTRDLFIARHGHVKTQ